jgi:hypothetical protein
MIMKKKIYLILLTMLFGFFIYETQAQVNYYEGWENSAAGLAGWTNSGSGGTFSRTTVAPCIGAASVRANLYTSGAQRFFTSPLLGTSQGGLTTLTFDYKVVIYASPPTTGAPCQNFTIEVQWTNNLSGNWMTLGIIDCNNHVVSGSCAQGPGVYQFTPAPGDPVYVRFINTRLAGDDYYYYDNVSVIEQIPPCAGTPAPGNTLASVNPACSGVNFTLSLEFPTPGSGVVYEWQSSPDGTNWTPFGPNAPICQTSQTMPMFYRCEVICSYSGLSALSTPVYITMDSFLNCYCNSNFTNVTYEYITNVTFAGIDNTSAGTTGGPVNYTNLIAEVDISGQVLLSVTILADANDYVYAFIDWNQNGILNDPGEVYTVAGPTSSAGPHTLMINIPPDAELGNTRMRVMVDYNNSIPNPCQQATFGEAEDYTVNVNPSAACPAPTNQTVDNIQLNGANLNWDHIWVESFFDVFIDIQIPNSPPPDISTVPTASGIDGNSYAWSDGQPGTTYDWYVRADCGFDNPRIDNFWMAMQMPGMLDPMWSGGTADDPGETGMWYLYDQAPGQPWWNIWFYNDPPDTSRIKKIRMGFWVQPFQPGFPSTINYVINWSTPDWNPPIPGFPTPADEMFIERSPVNGPFVVNGMQWFEIYYTIYDYNPEWISIDIWGENIIIEEMPMAPPPTSPLFSWWDPTMPGGMIVHECLPKSSLSSWTGPNTFTTTCLPLSDFPFTEDFSGPAFPPLCWSQTVTNTNATWIPNLALGVPNARVPWDYNQDEWLISPVFDFSGLSFINLKFDWMTSYAWSVDPNNNIDLNCKITTDGGLSWQPLWSEHDEGVFPNFIWQTTTLDLTNYAGQPNVMIAWQYVGNDGADVHITNVEIFEVPCDPPTNLHVVSVDKTSAILAWTGGDLWNVQVGPPGFTPGDGTAVAGALGTTQNPWTAEGLTEGTTYEFYVQNDCGFSNPKVDNFWMAMSTPGMLEPLLSGGSADDPFETGMWYLYNQASSQQWWNIWFYNDPPDTNRLKKIRMGFWVSPMMPGLPSTISYVFNWSTPEWDPPVGGFPMPQDEIYIERSPTNGPIVIDQPMWIELYYVIEDYNPEWISVDIWGENIIIEQAPMMPPPTSPLIQWWNPLMMGGLIVHECLPKSSTSDWEGPVPIETCQDYLFVIYAEICDDELPYSWEGLLITQPGTYQVSYPTTNPPGCDSTIILNLTVHPTYEFVTDVEICDGELYTWRGNDYSVAGQYTDTYFSQFGCDSVYVLNLIVHPTYEFVEDVDICEGDVYNWRGNDYAVEGTYTDSYVTQYGCDSVYVLNLTVHPLYEIVSNIEICEGETYTWRGSGYSVEGTYDDAYLSQYGCDSVYVLNLTVHPTYYFVEDLQIYDINAPYNWHGGSYSASGTYYANYQTVEGCDSIYQLNLTVKPYAPLWVTKNIGRAVQAEWLPKAGASLYQLRYRQPNLPPPLNDWVLVTQSTQLFRKIAPLSAGTTYELELRYRSGISWVQAYAPITFTTNVVSFATTYDIGTKFRLEWDDLGDEHYDVSSYVLQYYDPALGWRTKGYYPENWAVMTEMLENTTYQYRVLPRYNEVSFDWTYPGDVTSNEIVITTDYDGGTSADFSWDPVEYPDASDYYLQISGLPSIPVPFGTTCSADGLTPGASYNYRLVVRYDFVSWGATSWRPLQVNPISKEEVLTMSAVNALTVYPNPVSDIIIVEVLTTAETVNVWSLYDASGKLLMNGTGTLIPGLNTFELDVSQLSAGLYMLQISFNGTVESARILKQ